MYVYTTGGLGVEGLGRARIMGFARFVPALQLGQSQRASCVDRSGRDIRHHSWIGGLVEAKR